MTLDQLRIFIAVAEREHLTRAAEALNLTPSAVSAAIHALETRYGVHLFHRIGRRIELSQTGRLFLPFDARIGRKLSDNVALSFELGVPIIRDYPVYNLKTQVRLNVTY